ncbi:MAG: hypothetical protein V3W19_14525 [Desulfatiglandales bacterium]
MKHSQIISNQIKQANPGQQDIMTPFIAETDGVSVRVRLDLWDRLSVSLVDVKVIRSDSQAGESGQIFKDQCSCLAGRIGYLEESLSAVEVDETGRIGIIRSDPPRAEESTISFFEIEVNGKSGRIFLKRVVHDSVSGQIRPGRTVLGYHLLSRLIDDLSSAATDIFAR